MTELKALNDLEEGHVDTAWKSGDVVDGYWAVNKEELRDELIKHIQQLDKEIGDKAWYGDAYRVLGKLMIIDWIKDFANITDEDLK